MLKKSKADFTKLIDLIKKMDNQELSHFKIS